MDIFRSAQCKYAMELYGCWTKNWGGKPPKMDGENHGTPYEQMDDFGGNTIIFANTHMVGVYIPIIRIPIKRWDFSHPQ